VTAGARYLVGSAESVTLPTELPTLHAFRSTSLVPRQGVKPYFAVGRIERGRSEWWSRGKIWRSAPGSLIVKEMGDVHRDIALEGPNTCLLVALPAKDVWSARQAGSRIASPLIDGLDPGGAPLRRLLDAVMRGADRFTLEVALVEAVATLGRMSTVSAERTRPVRRAMDYLRAHLADAVTLDVLAKEAALDKFHLCRAFRAQVGMPPHTYLTHLRVHRARELLREGVSASEIAPRVGFYDQSLLNRHFRRIVGTTPASYGRRGGS